MKILADWFRAPNPGYVPLSQVSFGPLEIVLPHAVPQMPSPVGVTGGNIAMFNKLVDYPAIQQVYREPRLTRF